MMPKNKEEEHPDRPLECGECKRPIEVHYTEILGNAVTHIGMCSECPQLQKRLRGVSAETAIEMSIEGMGLVCGECGTNLETVKVSRTVGCSNCYEVFGDVFLTEMMTYNKLSPGLAKRKKSGPLHVGRSPGETQEVSPSLRLIALNEALDETLKREDYEQAAWLRDQIKALTEEPGDKKDGKKQ
jgi:protein arginine kinase activator